MFKDIIEAGGAGFLMPAVLFVLVLYLTRGLFGWHGRKSQRRKEFLELWQSERKDDDLWLEIAVRHLFGTYLPAYVIRLALKQPDNGQSLVDLSEVWPLFHFNPDTRQVRWRHRRYDGKKKLAWLRRAMLAAYVGCGSVAVLAAVVAARSGAHSLIGWAYGVFAVVIAYMAFICLSREESIKIAEASGEAWRKRINRERTRQTIREPEPNS